MAQFGEIGQGNKELAEKFFDCYQAVFAEGALSKREKALVALAVAHAVQCPYCIDAYTQACQENGSDLEEMTEAVHVDALEADYKRRLQREHGVTFDRLIALNNMPIARFLDWLIESDNLARYLQKLSSSFNPATVAGLMCRNTLSIGYDGRIYDCDFNQMLDLPAETTAGEPATVFDFDPATMSDRPIRTARHCYGCTAGAGSSCGGSIADEPGAVDLSG